MNHLIVIAAEGGPAPPAGAAVIRFAGIPLAGESVPADLPELRDIAAETVKRLYPGWLYDWALSSGAIDLAVWEGDLSWWWYGALSERSPQLTPLIHQLHQLTLFRQALRRWRPARVTWHDRDAGMIATARRVALDEGCDFEPVRVGRVPLRSRLAGAILLRLFAISREIIRAAGARLVATKSAPIGDAVILGFTRFPVLWEIADGVWRERMFGRLPEALARRGLPVAYAALASGGPLTWIRNWKAWRAVCLQNRVLLLNAYATIADLAAVFVPVGLWSAYWRWRQREQNWQVAFDGTEVGVLLRAAMDANVLDPNLAVNRLVARTLPRLLAAAPRVLYLLHPFEFQPMERAAAIGVRQARPIKVVALQTGLFTSGQMGFVLRREELRLAPADERSPALAPLPDLLAAYGRLPFAVFAEPLGSGRVIEVGATRYGGLAEFAAQPYRVEDERSALGLPGGYRHVLVATTALPEEAWPMIRAACAVAAARPDIFLSFKFHYHLPLGPAVMQSLPVNAAGRSKIFDSNLHKLIRAMDFVLTGASSVAYEVLALGGRPLVYLSPAAFHCNPATETRAAFSFWHSDEELLRLMEGGSGPPEAVIARALEDQMEFVPDGETRLVEAMERAAVPAVCSPAAAAMSR